MNVGDQLDGMPASSKLKLIGAGFGRTGTFSLKNALEELSLSPCYHMTELFMNEGATEQWNAIVRGAAPDWYSVFAGYQATVDWPACTYYKDLMRVYPDAKVLLSERDPEKWYESVANTIYPSSHRDPTSLHSRMVDTLIWQGTFGGKFEEKDEAIAIYLRHNEEVKQYVPPEKLLVYDVKQGWEPLCAFLGVAVPAEKPFPLLNDRESFLTRTRPQLDQLNSSGHV
jgi:hypothetical protein